MAEFQHAEVWVTEKNIVLRGKGTRVSKFLELTRAERVFADENPVDVAQYLCSERHDQE